MPNLEGIGLQNFRTFKDKEYLEFAPITLITGTNNSGKSSITKAIMLLKENFKDGDIQKSISLEGFKHKLGGLKRIYNNQKLSELLGTNQKIENNGVSNGSSTSLIRDAKYRQINDDAKLVFTIPVIVGETRFIKTQLNIYYTIKGFDIKHKNAELSSDISKLELVDDDKVILTIDFRQYSRDLDGWSIDTYISFQNILKLIKQEAKFDSCFSESANIITSYYRLSLMTKLNNNIPVFFDIYDTGNYYENIENIDSFLKEVYAFKEFDSISKYDFLNLKELTNENIRTLFGDEFNTNKLSIKGIYIPNDEIHLINNLLTINECTKFSFTVVNNDKVEKVIETKTDEDKLKQKTEEKQKELKAEELLNIGKKLLNEKLIKEFVEAVADNLNSSLKKSLSKFKNIYFLEASRGKNRAWFMDEQQNDTNEILREYSRLNLDYIFHKNIKDFISFWLGKGETELNKEKIEKGFNIGKRIIIERTESIGLTQVFIELSTEDEEQGKRISLVDLGYGLSQILPIIMKIAIVAYKNSCYHDDNPSNTVFSYTPSTLIIEEPESNLHPALQSKLTEMLIDAASRFHIQFILETHSEYMIYKFQQYVGKKYIKPSDLAIYYLNHPDDIKAERKDKNGNKLKYVNKVEIREDGSIDYEKYFGTGFFDEQTDLKLSLLNIQRNRFIELFEKTKEKFQSADNTLSEEKQFEKLSDEIDNHFNKLNYIEYERLIKLERYASKIDTSKTLKYLATGKYLLVNLDDSADFSPAIIQYGRATEYEMTGWVNDFKASLSPTDKTNWCNNFNPQIRTVINAIDNTILKNGNIKIGSSLGNLGLIVPYILKNSINSNNNDYMFGNIIQIFEFIYYISPTKDAINNYTSVDLLNAFVSYLRNRWNSYAIAEVLFCEFREIKNIRNNAAHGGATKKSRLEAKDYIDKVEAIFKCL